MAGGTKERILETARELFNQQGESNVTTQALADALNMSSGNLHYHFQTKRDIVLALFDRYEHALLAVIATPVDRRADLDDLWLLLHLSFELMGEYEFIYRDLTDLCDRYPKVRLHFVGLMRLYRETLELMMADFIDEGWMVATASQRNRLVETMLLLSNYWLAQHRVHSPQTTADPNHAVSLVMGALSPFLSPEAAIHLDHIQSQYQE